MNIKIVVLSFFMLMSYGSHEIMGVGDITYDPTNHAELIGLGKIVADLKEDAEEWKTNVEFLTKVKTNYTEVQRLYKTLDGLICSTEKLALYGDLSVQLGTCEKKLEIQIAFDKIEASSKGVKLVMTGAALLSQYETIESLKDLNDQLEGAVSSVNKIVGSLEREVFASLMDHGRNAIIESEANFDRQYGLNNEKTN